MNEICAWEQSANETGYNDAVRGIDRKATLKCLCGECLTAYEDGFQEAVEEIESYNPVDDEE